MKYCDSPASVPASPHYAAIVFETIWIPGDERSRTNPGHGYPEHSESTSKYIVFANKQEMEDWVKRQVANKYTDRNFTIIEAFPKTITTSVQIQ